MKHCYLTAQIEQKEIEEDKSYVLKWKTDQRSRQTSSTYWFFLLVHLLPSP